MSTSESNTSTSFEAITQNEPLHPEGQTNNNQPSSKLNLLLIRLIAYLIDGSILFFLNSLIYLFTDGSPIHPSDAIFTIANRLAYINTSYGFLVFLLYNAAFECSPFQATPGKALLQLKISSVDGQRISFWKAVLRNLIKPFSIIMLFMGYIMMFFNKKSQTLHDLITNSIVSKGNLPGFPRQKTSAIIWGGSGLLFVVLVIIPAFFNIPMPFKSFFQDVKVQDVSFKLFHDWQYTVETYEANEFEIVCTPIDYTLNKSLTLRGHNLIPDDGLSNKETAELLYNFILDMNETYDFNDIKYVKLIESTSFGVWPASMVFYTEMNKTENIIHQTIIFTVADKRIFFEYESPESDENILIINLIENTFDYKNQRK